MANNYPTANDWGSSPKNYFGKLVSTHGIVVSTEPNIIEVSYSIEKTVRVTIENVETDVKVGQQLGVFGLLVDKRTIVAKHTYHRYQWEAWYMYLVSALGVIWVVGRIIQQWTIDTTRLAIEPKRETTDTDA